MAKRHGRFLRDEGTTWPLHFDDDDNDSVEWRLRYGTPSKSDLMFAASVMNAYACLVRCSAKRRAEIVALLKELERKPASAEGEK